MDLKEVWNFSEIKGNVKQDVSLDYAVEMICELGGVNALDKIQNYAALTRSINSRLDPYRSKDMVENLKKLKGWKVKHFMSSEKTKRLIESLQLWSNKDIKSLEKNIHRPRNIVLAIVSSAYHKKFINYPDALQKKQNEDNFDLFDSQWRCYWVRGVNKTKSVNIAACLLRIKGKNDIELITDKDRIYTGKMKSLTTLAYRILLEGITDNVDNLERIMVLSVISGKNDYVQYIQGYMVSTSTSSKLYENDVLLEYVGKATQSLDIEVYPKVRYFSDDYYDNQIIPKLARYYFSTTINSRLSTSGEAIADIGLLTNAAKEKITGTVAYKHDLFVSSPFSSIEGKELKDIQGLVGKILSFLNEIKKDNGQPLIQNVFAAAVKNPDGSPATKKTFEEKYRSSFKEFERSRCYLLVMPKNVESFAKYQAAWVLAQRRMFLRKPTVIIYDKSVSLPNIFKNIHEYVGNGFSIQIDISKGDDLVMTEIKGKAEKIRDIYS